MGEVPIRVTRWLANFTAMKDFQYRIILLPKWVQNFALF